MENLSNFFKKKKTFIILNRNKKISYKKFHSQALRIAFYYQNIITKNKIIFLKTERSINFYIYIIGLSYLGATIVPISKKISMVELQILRKTYNPILEIDGSKKIPLKNLKKNLFFKKNLKKAKIIFFSSGTTGKPKGIQHNVNTLIKSALAFSSLSNYKKKDIILHNWPHYYMAGFFNMFLCALVSNSKIYFDDEIDFNSYLKYWKNIKKNKISIAYLSPTMAQALINYSSYNKLKDLSKLKCKIISTGSYLYKNTFNQFEEQFGFKLINCYGVTEVGGSISLADNEKNDSIGLLSKGIKILLSKKNEILIKSKYLFEGYLIEKNKLIKNKSKFFNTRDLGKKINNDYFIIGRNKEIIKKGGEQVSLLKIEDAVLSYPDVKDVIAKGVKSDFWGEEIEIDVVVDSKVEDKKLFLSNLSIFISQKLSKLEMPKKISIVETILKTSIGKNYRKLFE